MLSSISFIHFFFFNDTATTEIYTLSLHDALPISSQFRTPVAARQRRCAPRRPCHRIPCALVDRFACAHCTSFRVHHLCHGSHFCAGHLQGSESRQAVVPDHGGREPSQRWNGSRSLWHPERTTAVPSLRRLSPSMIR